jgi:hypothetical protein
MTTAAPNPTSRLRFGIARVEIKVDPFVKTHTKKNKVRSFTVVDIMLGVEVVNV